MAMASGIGAGLEAAPSDTPAHAYWFGEDQARYLVTVPADDAEAVIGQGAGRQRAGAPDRHDRRRCHCHSRRARRCGQALTRALRRLAAGLYGRRCRELSVHACADQRAVSGWTRAAPARQPGDDRSVDWRRRQSISRPPPAGTVSAERRQLIAPGRCRGLRAAPAIGSGGHRSDGLDGGGRGRHAASGPPPVGAAALARRRRRQALAGSARKARERCVAGIAAPARRRAARPGSGP